MEAKRKNLGRGLSALLGDTAKDYAELDRVRTEKSVPLGQLHPCGFQPRRRFSEAEITELAQSIKEKGILQPLVVRRDQADAATFEIICGERRWRAAQMAQLHEVPVLIKELSDLETLEIALIENVQREDLSALEEAEAYKRLMAEFGHSQDDMAKSMGKSRSHIANLLRLLNLPDAIKEMLDDGRLSAGHGRALLGASEPLKLAAKIIREKLSVRETENLIRQQTAKPSSSGTRKTKDADTIALEKELQDITGLKSDISQKGDGGSLTFHYGSLDQLEGVIKKLTA